MYNKYDNICISEMVSIIIRFMKQYILFIIYSFDYFLIFTLTVKINKFLFC